LGQTLRILFVVIVLKYQTRMLHPIDVAVTAAAAAAAVGED
jgi:hypothetical protein